ENVIVTKRRAATGRNIMIILKYGRFLVRARVLRLMDFQLPLIRKCDWDVGSKIDPHEDGTRNFFPAVAEPEFSTAGIFVGNQDQRSLESCTAQTAKAFVHQPFAESAGLIGRINRQMIDVSAASVVTTQCDANDRNAVGCHSAQSRV